MYLDTDNVLEWKEAEKEKGFRFGTYGRRELEGYIYFSPGDVETTTFNLFCIIFSGLLSSFLFHHVIKLLLFLYPL